jgi:hypothetical protein
MTKIRTAAGDELTEEDIEALADEAERGYDLDKAIKITVGRPSLGADGVSPRIQVRVDPTLATALRSRARREKRTVSEIARTALREYLDRAA